MHAFEEQSAPGFRREHGFERADLFTGESVDRQPQFPLVVVPLRQFFRFLLVEGDLEPPFRSVFDVDTRLRQQRVRPVREHVAACHAQIEVGAMKRTRALRGQDAGGSPGSSHAGLARIHEDYAHPAAQQFASDGQTDYARANDNHVRFHGDGLRYISQFKIIC